MSLDVLEAEICQWSANLTAAEARWLGLLAEFDRRGGWHSTGCVSCAAWLAWQTSMDRRTAHEKVRVAHAVVAFPRLGVEMGAGLLSYAKVRALSRIVNVDNVDALVDLALASTSNQVERFVSAFRRHEPDSDAAEARAHRERQLSVRNDGASATVMVRLPVEAAAVLVGCVDRFLAESDLSEPLGARRVDALLAMAAHAVAHADEHAPLDGGYLATVHLTPDVFDEDTPDEDTPDEDTPDDDTPDDDTPDDDTPAGGRNGDDVGGGCADGSHGGGLCCVAPGDGLGVDPVGVPRTSARRVLCDAVMQGYRHGDDDQIDVGYGKRVVSPRLKRSLRLRDGGCRFPGCTHGAWVDAHHVVHWLDHGKTRPTNLVCLCRRHHRLMHEGGWRITGDANGQLVFHRPDGTILAVDPPAVTGDGEAVADHGRSDRDGRCGWDGDRFDLAYTVSVIMDLEEHHQHQRQHQRTRHDESAESSEEDLEPVSPEKETEPLSS